MVVLASGTDPGSVVVLATVGAVSVDGGALVEIVERSTTPGSVDVVDSSVVVDTAVVDTVVVVVATGAVDVPGEGTVTFESTDVTIGSASAESCAGRNQAKATNTGTIAARTHVPLIRCHW